MGTPPSQRDASPEGGDFGTSTIAYCEDLCNFGEFTKENIVKTPVFCAEKKSKIGGKKPIDFRGKRCYTSFRYISTECKCAAKPLQRCAV